MTPRRHVGEARLAQRDLGLPIGDVATTCPCSVCSMCSLTEMYSFSTFVHLMTGSSIPPRLHWR
jgi:hypothetical protein